MSSLPSATILVLNYNGRHHLEACLSSLDAVAYPHASVTVIDNGSTDGSLEYLARHHPRVHVLGFDGNRGFAPAYNEAVRQADADVVVLLNNDTRVEPGWLSGLVDTMARHDAAAAASVMLDWEGRRIDFAGSLPTFIGHAWQVDHGLPVGRAYEERPLLFGCAGALAVRRDAFLDVGGFDDHYFVYFEDLDLGWRMTLAGHRTVLAPSAITYHRLHGTASGWGLTQRLRMYERNALYTVFKNYGDEALSRILPAAVTLTLARALEAADLEGETIRFGRTAPDTMALPPRVVSTLLALEDFARALPRLAAARRRIQESRRLSDEEVFALFPEPLRLHEAGDRYTASARALIRDFGIAEVFGLEAGRPRVSAGVPAPSPAPAEPDQNPVVSVVVLTASGARHLPDCLDALRAHDWPADRTDVIVVDNGSAEDPTGVAEHHYPGVRVVRTGANLGFSGGNNAGARVARGRWLVFLNDDTRVAPDWLHQMTDVAHRRQAACVGAFIVDWAGSRVDFAGGLANYEGRGYSLGYDLPVDEVDRTERPLLFGCGAAVMFRRDVFDESGGWDEPTFAYYEDVEFGWRLWLLGHEVWLAPRAIVHHKHHGTSGAESPPRDRAFERNALRMLYALLEDATLAQVLPAALLLAADRVLLGTPFSRADEGSTGPRSWHAAASRLKPQVVKVRLLHALSQRGARRQAGMLQNLSRVGIGASRPRSRPPPGSPPRVGVLGARAAYLLEESRPNAAMEGRHERLPAGVVARLLGIRDFVRMLPELSERRAWLQARRRRTDADIVGRFGAHWNSAVPSTRLDLHLELRRGVAAALAARTPLLGPLDLRGSPPA
ncbi:MAG: glycosyltransferase [Vicinamibacterales bacterium]